MQHAVGVRCHSTLEKKYRELLRRSSTPQMKWKKSSITHADATRIPWRCAAWIWGISEKCTSRRSRESGPSRRSRSHRENVSRMCAIAEPIFHGLGSGGTSWIHKWSLIAIPGAVGCMLIEDVQMIWSFALQSFQRCGDGEDKEGKEVTIGNCGRRGYQWSL